MKNTFVCGKIQAIQQALRNKKRSQDGDYPKHWQIGTQRAHSGIPLCTAHFCFAVWLFSLQDPCNHRTFKWILLLFLCTLIWIKKGGQVFDRRQDWENPPVEVGLLVVGAGLEGGQQPSAI